MFFKLRLLAINVLDLFSGIGGFSLGLERAGFKTVAFCEIEKYPQSIIKKHWPNVPIYEDVKQLTKEKLINDGINDIGLICGGYPCQPFSVAGKQRGQEDDRHLWPEMYRLIKSIRPRWVIAENVAGHINMGLDNVLSNLEDANYTWQTFVIPACAVNAIHRRDRVWIIGNAQYDGQSTAEVRQGHRKRNDGNTARQSQAQQLERSSLSTIDTYANLTRQLQQEGLKQEKWKRINNSIKDVTNPSSEGLQGKFRQEFERAGVRLTNSSEVITNSNNSRSQGGEKQGGNGEDRTQSHDEYLRGCDQLFDGFRHIELPTEPALCHRDDGISQRVARLKALGNAVVPQIPELIGRAIMHIENQTEGDQTATNKSTQ